ncbi:MAG: TRAP transporter large permease subunit, partial [Paracoccus sp. (in: a-proteobacteria)]
MALALNELADAQSRARAVEHKVTEELRVLDTARDDFVSDVSHELRTPLTTIHGYLEMVAEEFEDTMSPRHERMLEASRRSLGPALMIVASVFLVYTFLGPYMPDIIAHKGNSLAEVVNHQWITTEGVFGIALGVSTSFVFLFVLFGALLDKAGAGNYFIKLAFSMLGHYRGGPAKAAVVASGMTGLISGSSIANVVTTGTFTVPMMKRVGFSAEKAGAVEVASSVNGQIMPPVMGAAAFLMVEYVGISYVEVIKHAFLPALISYIALIYIVHLEALKAGMQGLKSNNPVKPLLSKVIGFSTGLIGLMALSFVVYYGLGWL